MRCFVFPLAGPLNKAVDRKVVFLKPLVSLTTRVVVLPAKCCRQDKRIWTVYRLTGCNQERLREVLRKQAKRHCV